MKCKKKKNIPLNMKCLYNVVFKQFKINLRGLFCFTESMCIEASKRLTASHPFNYTNDSLKMSTN